MIENELLFLGLLRESPKHGYEIKRKIKEIISLFAGVEPKSIYYPLRILEKKQLVEKRVIKQGSRPQRVIYRLTPKGELRFEELLSKSFLDFRRPQFSLDMSLYFLQYMPPDLVTRRLRARQLILKRIAQGLSQMAALQKSKNPSLKRILEHNQRMVEAENAFLANLTNPS